MHATPTPRAAPARLALCLALATVAVALSAGCSTTAAADQPIPIPTVERFTYTADTGLISALRSVATARAHGTTVALPAADPRIVYVHGTPGDATAWQRYLDDPVSGVASVALDRPGFGESEPEGPVISIIEQATALEPLLVDEPILVGHSLGAPIIAMAAALWPDRVGGLVIISGSLDPSLEEQHWYNRLGTALGDALPRELVNANAEILAVEPELRDLARRLDRVRCPVVLVHGTADQLVEYANVDFMRAAFSSAQSLEVITLDGGDHFIIWREETVPVIREAIASLVAPRDV